MSPNFPRIHSQYQCHCLKAGPERPPAFPAAILLFGSAWESYLSTQPASPAHALPSPPSY